MHTSHLGGGELAAPSMTGEDHVAQRTCGTSCAESFGAVPTADAGLSQNLERRLPRSQRTHPPRASEAPAPALDGAARQRDANVVTHCLDAPGSRYAWMRVHWGDCAVCRPPPALHRSVGEHRAREETSRRDGYSRRTQLHSPPLLNRTGGAAWRTAPAATSGGVPEAIASAADGDQGEHQQEKRRSAPQGSQPHQHEGAS